ncbi:hypothetical protein [Devosia sp.]|uniref:hypothetical protein n=1 Tax=Devosia sp. TaxID=1871048 RepID=UPI003A91DCC8
MGAPMIGLGVSLARNVRPGGGLPPQASALFARFSAAPDPARQQAIGALIEALVDGGVWSKLDALYVLAAHDGQAALRNWVADQYNLSEVAAPDFLADRGYSGDGATSYLSCNTAGGLDRFTRNDCHMGIWSLSNLLNAGSASQECGNTNCTIVKSSGSGGTVVVRPNTASGIGSAPSAHFPGLIGWSRFDTSNWELFAHGLSVGARTDASAALEDTDFWVCGRADGNFGVNRIAACHFGAALNAMEWSVMHAALSSYLDAMGAV